jgi:hypothetical protein
MKLIIQIALGVFLGVLGAQFMIDWWHIQQTVTAESVAKKQHTEQEKIQTKQAEQIRKLLIQGGKVSALRKHQSALDLRPNDPVQNKNHEKLDRLNDEHMESSH